MICAGIMVLINPEEVFDLEMLAMELITFFCVSGNCGNYDRDQDKVRRRERANCAANRNFNYFCNLLYNWIFCEG